MNDIAAPFLGPWPDGVELSRAELDAYLSEVGDGALDSEQSACSAWTVSDVTRHLAATFTRFDAMLQQGRSGDFTPPFEPDELDDANLTAVAEFEGEPTEALRTAATRFLDSVDALDEPMPHQFGTLPVELQVLFGLTDLCAHHDDVLFSTGRRYRPSDDAIAAVQVVAERLMGFSVEADDPWPLLLAASGRRQLS